MTLGSAMLRVTVDVTFSAREGAPPRTVRHRNILAPTRSIEQRLVPGIQVPVAFDPSDPQTATILWEEAGLDLHESH